VNLALHWIAAYAIVVAILAVLAVIENWWDARHP